jgi:hypothetical protein
VRERTGPTDKSDYEADDDDGGHKEEEDGEAYTEQVGRPNADSKSKALDASVRVVRKHEQRVGDVRLHIQN